MVLSVQSRTKRLIESKLRSGGYESADALIEASLGALAQQERWGDFAPGELNQLLDEGERSGQRGGIPASKVFADLRRRDNQKRRARKRDEADYLRAALSPEFFFLFKPHDFIPAVRRRQKALPATISSSMSRTGPFLSSEIHMARAILCGPLNLDGSTV